MFNSLLRNNEEDILSRMQDNMNRCDIVLHSGRV